MKDSKNLRKEVTKWLAYIAPTLAPIEKYERTGQDIDQYWDFLKRGVIKRWHEALDAICNMAEIGVGHFGVTLVRPAFEELVWIEYLDKNKSKANELVVLLTMQEIAANLVAQNDYVGVKGMKALGFTQRFVKSSLARNRNYNKQIRDLVRELGWPKRREGALPSMAFLARKVGRAQEYGFLYQGTSRYVHFSTTEILRRVWGVKGEVTIGTRVRTH